jgi:hypothetical protein
MLNDYHIQFLHHFVRHNVDFLIVGGQARWLSDRAHKTRDLDLWVSIAEVDKPNLERTLVVWSGQHPAHTAVPLQAPLPLRPGCQIAFPDCDGVAYIDRSGVIQELSTADRIDVLTSEGVEVRVMCAPDLEKAGRLRAV